MHRRWSGGKALLTGLVLSLVLQAEIAPESRDQEGDARMGSAGEPPAARDLDPDDSVTLAPERDAEGAHKVEGVTESSDGEVCGQDTVGVSGTSLDRVDGDMALANATTEEGIRERGQEGGESHGGDMSEQGLIDRERNESNGGEVSRRDDSATGSGRDRKGRPTRGRAKGSDWRRGKRERSEAERDPRSSSPAGDDERGRKRRKSGDLPLSPDETKFRMGAREGRGSPRFERDRRRGRYQPPRTPSEEDQKATLYVGDIEARTSKWDLRRTFERFGDVKEAKMITGQCYGFVTFR